MHDQQWTWRPFSFWQLYAWVAVYIVAFQWCYDWLSWLSGEEANWGLLYWLGKFLVNYPSALLLILGNFWLIRWLDRFFSWSDGWGITKRLVVEIPLSLAWVALLVLLINIAIHWIGGEDWFSQREILYSMSIGGIINLSLLPIMEFYWQSQRHHQIQMAYERLQLENSNYRYEVLRNQLNPHFLFNSLTSLSSLISIDARQAKQFVHKLSHVYRHVLEYKNEEMIPLSAELDFAEDYTFLLKTRFGEALQVEWDIPDEVRHRKIVPMALQLLIENAVKHNVTSVSSPLIITIFADQEKLSVRNNLQVKSSAASWGLGLSSIQERYQGLKAEIQVHRENTHFEVVLPLLS